MIQIYNLFLASNRTQPVSAVKTAIGNKRLPGWTIAFFFSGNEFLDSKFGDVHRHHGVSQVHYSILCVFSAILLSTWMCWKIMLGGSFQKNEFQVECILPNQQDENNRTAARQTHTGKKCGNRRKVKRYWC
jgi:hypothetical protein